VTIRILPRGDLAVTEVQEYVLDGKWNGGYRDLLVRGCKDYRDIKLWEGDRRYEEGSVEHKGGYIIERHGQTVRVKWRSREKDGPRYDDEHVTFKLKYRVVDAVTKVDGRDELYWQPLFPERTADIKHARVMIHLPASCKAGDVKREGPRRKVTEAETGDTIREWGFEAENVKPGEDLEFRISWPARTGE